MRCGLAVWMIGTYLIGSISFGSILSKVRGIDIFSEGSGSPGATNINRSFGLRYAVLIFLLDFFKGFLPTWMISLWVSNNPRLLVVVIVGLLLGHCFSIFYKFRGGKGVSTAIGGLMAIMPNVVIFGILVWMVIFYGTRMVSVASLCFISSTMLTAYLFGHPAEYEILTLILSIIIFLRHKENISRLISGTEYKFTKR